MCNDVEKAIESCGGFLSSLGKDVQYAIRPYHDDKEDELGYSLTLSVRQPDGSWYLVDSNHRFPTNGMSLDDTVEDIKRVIRHRVAIGYSLAIK